MRALVFCFLLSLAIGIDADDDSAKKKVEKKSVKIVEAPVVSRSYYSSHTQKKLVARVTPAKYHGPESLKALLGTCLSLKVGDYKYEVCPFQNVTQHEQTTRWNAYKGVLGVFQGWKVVNGSLYSMMMLDGDGCGTSGTYRQAEIIFQCSTEHKLSHASEPSTCHYQLIYEIPAACNSSLMAVYYQLNSSQQQQWREVQELFFHNEITFKGVSKRMDEIYVEAGLVPIVSKATDTVAKGESTSNTGTKQALSSSQFTSLSACEKVNHDLEERVKLLEAELTLLRPNSSLLKNSTNSTHHLNQTNTHHLNQTNTANKTVTPSVTHHQKSDDVSNTPAPAGRDQVGGGEVKADTGASDRREHATGGEARENVPEKDEGRRPGKGQREKHVRKIVSEDVDRGVEAPRRHGVLHERPQKRNKPLGKDHSERVRRPNVAAPRDRHVDDVPTADAPGVQHDLGGGRHRQNGHHKSESVKLSRQSKGSVVTDDSIVRADPREQL